MALLLMLSGMAQAQTPSPTSATDLAIELFADLRFPGEIYLEAVIPLPAADVVQVELVIQAQALPPMRVTFPPEVYAFADEYVIARYTWAITPETQPPLFSTVTYAWRITTSAGQVFGAGDSITYADERLDWQETLLPNVPITLMIPALLSINLRSLDAQLTTLYRRLQADNGGNHAFRFLLLPDAVPLGCDEDAEGNPIVIANFINLTQETLPCDVRLAERAYQNSDYDLFVLSEPGEAFFVLRPPIVTTFYAPIWEEYAVPAWFRAGLERFYIGTGGNRLQSVSRNAILQAGTPLTLEQMQTEPTDSREQNIWQAQSYGMVLYIAWQMGIEPTFALAQTEDFVTAVEAALGMSLTTLIADWSEWVLTDDAVRVYSYSIYTRTTPTPTATFTPTLTRTPRPPTETPTLTPDYSPTPRPSRTPLPPTATITPLPAQSFSLRSTAVPTPIPATIANSPISGLTLPQVVVGGVVLAAGIVLLVLLFRRRE